MRNQMPHLKWQKGGKDVTTKHTNHTKNEIPFVGFVYFVV